MNICINNKTKVLNFLLSIIDNDSDPMYYLNNLVEIYPNVLDYILSNKTPDLSKVKYVKSKRWNYLKEKVLENIDLLELNQLLDDVFDIQTLRILKNYYSNKNNNDTSFENKVIYKLIKFEPYDTLCKIPGISFNKADSILMAAFDKNKTLWEYNLRKSKQRCTSFIIYYLLTQLNGSTYTTKSNLINVMNYHYNLQECVSLLDDSLKDFRLIFKNDKIMLKTSYLEELNISNYIKEALKYNNDWNINIDYYSIINNFTLTSDQLKTLKLINNYQLVLLNGYAGTGKSSSIKALINMLEDNNKSYVILAPTAKAAKTISAYTDRRASTIHYLLCSNISNFNYEDESESTYSQASNINEFKYAENDKLDYDIIIIDESSMLSVPLFNTLLRYIDPSKTKLLMIGDSYQLPSIQNGNLYQDLLEISDIPKVTLNEIFRYTENGLINVATNVRLGNKYLSNESEQNIGTSYSFFEYTNNSDMLNAVLNKYYELINSGNDIQDIAILTAKNIGNTGTNLLNSCVQRVINPISEYDDVITIKVDKNDVKFKENDVVMNIKNKYNAVPLNDEDQRMLIANGQTGIVKSVNPFEYTMIVNIDGLDFKFEYADICNLRLAYCFTIHKAQGSQFKNIIYLTTKEDMFMTNSNLLYVAITRAQEKCYHYGSSFVVNSKVNERENLKRNTTLVLQYNNEL